jgi:Family of unknown function (DUF7003)
VIEAVGYNPRGLNLFDVLHVYGNCIDGRPGFENGDFIELVDNYEAVEDPDESERLRPDAPPLEIRGRRIAHGGHAGDALVDVFRRLVPAHRELLLATEAELRRRIPADLPGVLRLEEWNHPDVSGDVPPSSSPTSGRSRRCS